MKIECFIGLSPNSVNKDSHRLDFDANHFEQYDCSDSEKAWEKQEQLWQVRKNLSRIEQLDIDRVLRGLSNSINICMEGGE
jgi:hypothetical protein